MKAAAIFLTKLKASRTSTAMALRMLAEAAVTGLMVIVRMAEIVAGAAGVPAAAGEIVDAAGAADGLVVAGAIVDVAGLVAGDTRNFSPRICADSRG